MIDTGIQEADPSGCIFADVQPKNSPFYLSPNVIMTTKPSDPSDVYPGTNTTSVTVTWSKGCAIQEGNDLGIVFDLYAGDPTLPMIPGSTLDTLSALNSITITAGQSTSTTITWDAGTLPHLSQPHHACLLARAYPFGASAAPGDLTQYPPEDEHYAQHNCTVNTADGQGLYRLPIRNGNLRPEPEFVLIQAIPDLAPSRATLDAVLPSLRLIPGFKQIATKPLRQVELDLSPFKSHHESLLEKIEQWIEMEIIRIIEALEGKSRNAGGVTARAVLPPNFFAKFNFSADLSGSTPGDAHIYQVSQVNGKGQSYGGLTAVVVAP